MMRMGCNNCSNFKWDEENHLYYCSKEKQIDPDVFDSVWVDEEDWDRNEHPLCSEYKECGGVE